MPKQIKNIAIVGTGVIGASWAALYLARGLNVIATDPAPNAPRVRFSYEWTLRLSLQRRT